MIKSERAEFVLARLQALYPNPPVPLDHSNAFTLLVAVLLSAQCTDERVNMVTPELFAKADNARDMAKVRVPTILRIIRSCGLSPRKSKAISELSKILVDEHDGEVPADMEALERLPGVGHKTGQRCDGSSIWCSCLSRGHSHPSLGSTVGPDPRQKRQANRSRLKTNFSRTHLE